MYIQCISSRYVYIGIVYTVYVDSVYSNDEIRGKLECSKDINVCSRYSHYTTIGKIFQIWGAQKEKAFLPCVVEIWGNCKMYDAFLVACECVRCCNIL